MRPTGADPAYVEWCAMLPSMGDPGWAQSGNKEVPRLGYRTMYVQDLPFAPAFGSAWRLAPTLSGLSTVLISSAHRGSNCFGQLQQTAVETGPLIVAVIGHLRRLSLSNSTTLGSRGRRRRRKGKKKKKFPSPPRRVKTKSTPTNIVMARATQFNRQDTPRTQCSHLRAVTASSPLDPRRLPPPGLAQFQNLR